VSEGNTIDSCKTKTRCRKQLSVDTLNTLQ
jgi:hypothetical protein